MTAADPAPWADPAPGRPVPFWAALAADVVAHVPPALRVRSRASWAVLTLKLVLMSSGLHVTMIYRVAHASRPRLWPAGWMLSAAIFWATRHAYGCSIAPSSRLHGGLILPHPQGIVVGAGVELGPRAWIYQNVTLGGSPGREGFPRAGSDARFYAGAVVAGPVVLGDGVIVGANAVVTRDVPSGWSVRPAPTEASPPRRPDANTREDAIP